MQRVRLFDSVVAVQRRSAHRQPLLFVFDDLHCADGASIRLLHALADEIADVLRAARDTHHCE